MLFSDIIKLLFKKSSSTSFRIFQDFFYTLLKVCGVENILIEGYSVRWSGRVRLFSISLILLLGELSGSLVIWNYPRDIEEVITSTISVNMMFQGISKFAEVIADAKSHREMLKMVEEKTQELQNDPENRRIGISNFNRARFYVTISTVSYLSALVSLFIYPFYALLVNHEFKLIANMELPGTKHKELIGWMINYIFGIFIGGFTAVFILGNDSLRKFSIHCIIFINQLTTFFTTFTCFISLNGWRSWRNNYG